MKILLVLDELILTGIAKRKEDMFTSLVNMHKSVSPNIDVLAANTKYLESEDTKSFDESIKVIPVNGLHLVGLSMYIFSLPVDRNFIRFARYVYTFRAELSAMDYYLKSNSAPPLLTALQCCECSGIVSYIISRKYKIRYIVLEDRTQYQRGHMIGQRGRIVSRVLSSAERILTVSPQLSATIKKSLGLNNLRVEVMPNPIPDSFFTAPSQIFSKVNSFAKGRFIFAGWTNWRDIKRLDLAIDAFCQVKKVLPDTCMVIAGPVSDDMRNKIDTLGLNKSILLLGPINREQIKLLAYESDCCIIPSDHETFGLPAIEALAAGKPVVATKCGGPESVITDSSLGRLVEVGDKNGFADAMQDVVINYDSFDSAHLRTYCRETFSETQLAKKWSDVYKDIVQN